MSTDAPRGIREILTERIREEGREEVRALVRAAAETHSWVDEEHGSIILTSDLLEALGLKS